MEPIDPAIESPPLVPRPMAPRPLGPTPDLTDGATIGQAPRPASTIPGGARRTLATIAFAAVNDAAPGG